MIALGFTSVAPGAARGADAAARRASAPSVLDRVELRAGEVWTSREGAAPQEPACIRVLDGAVWITQAGDPSDYVLHAGEVFRARGDGLIVAQAIEGSRLIVRPLRGN